MCARHIRADISFGEQILDIADDSRNDWLTAKNGKQIPNKELVLRSKAAHRGVPVPHVSPQRPDLGRSPEDRPQIRLEPAHRRGAPPQSRRADSDDPRAERTAAP